MWKLTDTKVIPRRRACARRTRVLIAPGTGAVEVINEIVFDAGADHFLMRRFEREPD